MLFFLLNLDKRLRLHLLLLGLVILQVGILPDKTTEALKCYKCGGHEHIEIDENGAVTKKIKLNPCNEIQEPIECDNGVQFCRTIIIKDKESKKLMYEVRDCNQPGINDNYGPKDYYHNKAFATCVVKEFNGCTPGATPFDIPEPGTCLHKVQDKYSRALEEEANATMAYMESKARQIGGNPPPPGINSLLISLCYCETDLCNKVGTKGNGGNGMITSGGNMIAFILLFLVFLLVKLESQHLL